MSKTHALVAYLLLGLCSAAPISFASAEEPVEKPVTVAVVL